jgi:hypothetical protein
VTLQNISKPQTQNNLFQGLKSNLGIKAATLGSMTALNLLNPQPSLAATTARDTASDLARNTTEVLKSKPDNNASEASLINKTQGALMANGDIPCERTQASKEFANAVIKKVGSYDKLPIKYSFNGTRKTMDNPSAGIDATICGEKGRITLVTYNMDRGSQYKVEFIPNKSKNNEPSIILTENTGVFKARQGDKFTAEIYGLRYKLSPYMNRETMFNGLSKGQLNSLKQ